LSYWHVCINVAYLFKIQLFLTYLCCSILLPSFFVPILPMYLIYLFDQYNETISYWPIYANLFDLSKQLFLTYLCSSILVTWIFDLFYAIYAIELHYIIYAALIDLTIQLHHIDPFTLIFLTYLCSSNWPIYAALIDLFMQLHLLINLFMQLYFYVLFIFLWHKKARREWGAEHVNERLVGEGVQLDNLFSAAAHPSVSRYTEPINKILLKTNDRSAAELI